MPSLLTASTEAAHFHPGKLHQVPYLDGAAGGIGRLLGLAAQVQGLLGLVQTVPHGGLGVVELLEVDLLLLLAAQLVQLGENFVGLGLGLAHDALGLGLALGAGVVLGFFHLLPEGPAFRASSSR